MAFFRTGGGGGIPAFIKSGMNAVLNKKFGTEKDYNPVYWPDDVNLLGKLEEKTVQAAPIAAFSDGADDVPTVETIVNVDYTGSLIGDYKLFRFGKNLLNDTIQTINASTLLFNDNSNPYSLEYLPAGTYTFKYYARAGVTPNAIQIVSGSAIIAQDFTSPTQLTFTINEPKSNVVIRILKYTGWTAGDIIGAQLETGATATDYEEFKGSKLTSTLGRQIYGGFFNTRTGVLTSTKAADGSDLPDPVEYQTFFTLTYNSLSGYNNIFCNTGDVAVTYRSIGTIITPTLISKTITENGTYNAADDDADGYSSVTVAVQGAICQRLMYARCVNNDQEEIPAISNIDQGINYSTYLSYDSTTKKFTVLQDFTGIVVAWVYAYRAYEMNRPDGAFYLNNTQMLNYETTGNAEGSTGGRSGAYNFKQGDTFYVYTPTRHGYPQQNCKVYLVSDINDSVFTFADEELTS